jgi:hypothetical protein
MHFKMRSGRNVSTRNMTVVRAVTAGVLHDGAMMSTLTTSSDGGHRTIGTCRERGAACLPRRHDFSRESFMT